ncbi:glutamate--tRNA ligase [bacterium]|nr:glutamate--tRNA ligase [bacterium]
MNEVTPERAGDNADTGVRVRFAPSPTGYLHTGGARTALFNWLLARSRGGSFILRIEDTDEERSTDESTRAILDGLRWLGLDWDEGPEVGGEFGPYFQSERKELHLKFADRLLKDGHAFVCNCPKDDGPDEKPKFDENCRERPLSEQLKLLAKNPALPLRLKVDRGRDIAFTDMIRGQISVSTDEIGDIVIVKSTGGPVYNFSCVIDDATMNITHVLRGEDHLSNTPKQLLIYEKLGWEPPQFAHLPLIVGMDRARLSKRHGATSVTAYRELGILPEALVNFLLLIGWAPKDDREEFTRDEMIGAFSMDGIGKSAGAFNTEKLFWFNGKQIRSLSDEEYLRHIFEFVPNEWKKAKRDDHIAKVMLLFKDRVTYFAEIEELAWYFFRPTEEYNEDAWQRIIAGSDSAEMVLKEIPAALKALPEFDCEHIEEVMRGYAKDKGLKLKDVIQPLRVAITGDRFSPGFFEMAELLGASEIARRSSALLAKLSAGD